MNPIPVMVPGSFRSMKMENKTILTEMVRHWRLGQKDDLTTTKVEFYSGRIMIYHLMVVLKYKTAEALYWFKPKNILDFSVESIVLILIGEKNINDVPTIKEEKK